MGLWNSYNFQRMELTIDHKTYTPLSDCETCDIANSEFCEDGLTAKV